MLPPEGVPRAFPSLAWAHPVLASPDKLTEKGMGENQGGE